MSKTARNAQESSDLLRDKAIREESREYAVIGLFGGSDFMIVGPEENHPLLGAIAAELEGSEEFDDVRFLEKRITIREQGI